VIERIMMKKPKLALFLMNRYRAHKRRSKIWGNPLFKKVFLITMACILGLLVGVVVVFMVSTVLAAALSSFGVVVGTLLGIGVWAIFPALLGFGYLMLLLIDFFDSKSTQLYSWAKKQEQLWEQE